MSIRHIVTLLQSQKIVGQSINITFAFAGVVLPVESKDVIGTVIQSWFASWMTNNNIQYSGGPNTQSWPDFILSDGKDFEVKAFDGNASPNFDLGNFDTYTRSLLTHPERLDTDHLIFEYNSNNGAALITNCWVKKIWEMTGSSEKNILNLQVKQGVVHNIRPKNWRSNAVSIFQSRRDFVVALSQVLTEYDRDGNTWFSQVETAYRQRTGSML